MLERLDRAFTSQRQFIANASHELRTPLTVMRTAIDVVLAKPDPTPDELVSMVAEVRQAVDHAERLIEALLVLARNEQARVLTDPLDLAAVAEDALEGRTATGITRISTLDEAPVTGDAVLLERLVANLLDNAERYNIDGGTVSISTTTDNGASIMRVINTGAVVPADRSTGCSCRSRGSTTEPATKASASASPSSHRSPPCTAAPSKQPRYPPVDWTSAFASRGATPPTAQRGAPRDAAPWSCSFASAKPRAMTVIGLFAPSPSGGSHTASPASKSVQRGQQKAAKLAAARCGNESSS